MGSFNEERRNKMYQDCLSNLEECAELVGEYFEGDQRNHQLEIIKGLAKMYYKESVAHDISKAALKLTEDYFSKEDHNRETNIEEVYTEHVRNHGVRVILFENHPDMKKIIHSLHNASNKAGTSDDVNESLILTQSAQLPVDPITKAALQDPWKNKVCGHVYEYNVIVAYIESKKFKVSRCPYVGCANTNIQISDLVKDEDLSMRIREKSQGIMSNLESSVEEID